MVELPCRVRPDLRLPALSWLPGCQLHTHDSEASINPSGGSEEFEAHLMNLLNDDEVNGSSRLHSGQRGFKG
jgi:hypothetical protein